MQVSSCANLIGSQVSSHTKCYGKLMEFEPGNLVRDKWDPRHVRILTSEFIDNNSSKTKVNSLGSAQIKFFNNSLDVDISMRQCRSQ